MELSVLRQEIVSRCIRQDIAIANKDVLDDRNQIRAARLCSTYSAAAVAMNSLATIAWSCTLKIMTLNCGHSA